MTMTNDHDLLGDEAFQDRGGSIVHGTVGHEGVTPHYSIDGDAISATLVDVTLFRGAPVGAAKSASGLANGQEIKVRIGDAVGWWCIPKRGQRVVVAIPEGLEGTPGAGVIIGKPGAGPKRQFGETQAILDLSDYDVVLKGKSISLISEDKDESGAIVRTVASVSRQGGAQLVDATGSGFFVADGEAQMKVVDGGGALKSSVACTQTSASLLDAAGATCKLKSGNMTCAGLNVALNFNAVGLGAGATPGTPVQVGSTPGSGVPSASVFGAP